MVFDYLEMYSYHAVSFLFPDKNFLKFLKFLTFLKFKIPDKNSFLVCLDLLKNIKDNF